MGAARWRKLADDAQRGGKSYCFSCRVAGSVGGELFNWLQCFDIPKPLFNACQHDALRHVSTVPASGGEIGHHFSVANIQGKNNAHPLTVVAGNFKPIRSPTLISLQCGNLARVRIHVHPDGLLEVEAPEEADSHAIREAVRVRAQWIVGHLREIETRRQHVLPRDYVSGESHFYLGRRYMLTVEVLDAAALRCKLGQGKQPAKTGVKLSGAYLTVTIRQPQFLRIHEDASSHRRPVILTSCEDKTCRPLGVSALKFCCATGTGSMLPRFSKTPCGTATEYCMA